MSLITIICPEVDTSIPEHRVCWQCEANLRNIMRFRKRVLMVQDLLNRAVEGELVDPKGIWCLSTTEVEIQSILPDKDVLNEVDSQKEVENYIKVEIKEESQDIKIEENVHYDEDTDSCQKISDSEISLVTESMVIDSGPTKRVAKDNNFDMNSSKIKGNTAEVIVTYENERMCTMKVMKDAEMFAFREALKNDSIYKNCAFKCELCVKRFMTKSRYDEHKVAHYDAAGDFLCHVCKLRFPTENEMIDHRNSHYKCYTCAACRYETTSLDRMTRHYDTTHYISHQECKDCDATFKSLKDYRRHRKQVHLRKKECKVCGHAFTTFYELNAHAKRHTGEIPVLECELCHKMYKGSIGLRRHIMHMHSTKIDESAYCAECNMQFKNVYIYRTHLRTSRKHNPHQSELKHKCKECDKPFAGLYNLQRHMEAVHLKLLNHKCDICGQAYNCKRQLKRHKAIKHEGRQIPKDKLCDYCGKGFRSKKELLVHINTHTGARPYICPDCGADFGHPAALYTHRRLKHKVKRLKDLKADA